MADQKTTSYDLLISNLDRFIRKYYINSMIKGLLLSLGLVIGAFVLFNVLEYLYYFDTGVRKLFFFGFIGLTLSSLCLWVIYPLLKFFHLGKVISHYQASQIIGQHFGDVKDKLLNILQLHDSVNQSASPELALASIERKTSAITPIPFKNAIDLSKNKKHLKYALPPLLVLFGLLIMSPTLIKDSTSRIIRNDESFSRPAPFQFIVENQDLKVEQYGDFELTVKVEGKTLPSEAYLEMNNFRYLLKAIDKNHYSYSFKDVPKDLTFKLAAGEVASQDYLLSVLPVPSVQDFSMSIDYPAYTRRRDEIIKNTGNAIVPIGSKISWEYEVGNTDDLTIQFNKKSETQSFAKDSDKAYSFAKRIYEDDQYTISLSNDHIKEAHSFDYGLTVVPDLPPIISFKQFVDSADASLQYFVGEASDDYGLTNITVNYTIVGQEGNTKTTIKESLVRPKSTSSAYQYTLDIPSLGLTPGDELEYYFEAFDNDGINGIKSTKTQILRYRQLSDDELEDQEDENNEAIKDNLSKSLEELAELKKEMKSLKEKLLQEKNLNWQTKKQLEQLLERHKELLEEIRKAQEKFEENVENQKEQNEKTEEKQENLQELFEEMQDPEREDLMQKIQELMDELKKDQALDMMKDMEMSDDQLEMEMDRMLELFKTLEVEKEIQDMVEKLEELAEKEEDLSEESKAEEDKDQENTDDSEKEDEENADDSEKKNEEDADDFKKENEENTDSSEEKKDDSEKPDEENKDAEESDKDDTPKSELEKKQEELTEDFEKMEEEMKELLEKNKDLERPKQLGEPQEDMESIKKDMQNSQDQLKKKQNKKASKSQKNASEKMKQMAQDLQQQMESGDMEQMEEDLKTLRQLLENLVELSFDQEELISDFSSAKINTPYYVNLVQNQYKLKDDFKIVEDSLVALSKRVDQIESFITDKIVSIKGNFGESLDLLEERQKTAAANNQQRTMKDVNDLALMLSETMEQMQQQMANQMPGSQSCENPKPGGKGGEGKMPMDKMSQQQEGLNGEMKKMGEKLKNGMEGQAEQYAKMAARQAAIRDALKEYGKGQKQQGKGSKDLEDLINQMNQVETDLVNKKLSNETLKRQQEILTRLLKAENAERQQEMDQQRKSETAIEKRKELPSALKEYLKERNANIDIINKAAPNLKPFYKNLVNEYIRQSQSAQ